LSSTRPLINSLLDFVHHSGLKGGSLAATTLFYFNRLWALLLQYPILISLSSDLWEAPISSSSEILRHWWPEQQAPAGQLLNTPPVTYTLIFGRSTLHLMYHSQETSEAARSQAHCQEIADEHAGALEQVCRAVEGDIERKRPNERPCEEIYKSAEEIPERIVAKLSQKRTSCRRIPERISAM
jgi:hypothetical protein